MSEYPRYDALHVRLGKNVGPGWLLVIEKLIEDLDASFPGWHASQIKEKFGGLRFYANPPEDLDDEERANFYALIDDAEQKASKLCEICGEPGDTKPGPEEADAPYRWIKTLCDKHKGERPHEYS